MLVEEGFQVTVQLIHKNWRKELTAALRADASELRIICPFIQVGALDSLLSLNPGNIQVITRFKISDFVNGVSDVAALRKLLEADAQVRGIKKLHAKLYLSASRAIVASANLTEAALDTNHELGLVIDDASLIKDCRDYFDDLWRDGKTNLSDDLVDLFEKKVTHYRDSSGGKSSQEPREDYGADTSDVSPSPVRMPKVLADGQQAFVKLLGDSGKRHSLSTPTIEMVDLDGCHWKVSVKKPPKKVQVQDGDIIFMAWPTRDQDYRIFGWAFGRKYQPGRDDATAAEKKRWKQLAEWQRHIRVRDPEFVDGFMANGISLDDMEKELGANTFALTQSNTKRGKGENTNPRRIHRTQPAIKLSAEGYVWLSEKLQKAFVTHGEVPQTELDKLDLPTLPDF